MVGCKAMAELAKLVSDTLELKLGRIWAMSGPECGKQKKLRTLLGPNRYQNFTHCLQSILINANIAAVI